MASRGIRQLTPIMNQFARHIAKHQGGGDVMPADKWLTLRTAHPLQLYRRNQDVRHSNLPSSTEGDINIPVLPFNRRQDGELQDRAARGKTNGATGGVLQAGGPPSGETSYRAPYMPATDVDLQSLKRKLKQKLGNKYKKHVANCDRTFNGTTLSEADISKCSSQLLYYVGDNAVKCMVCKHTGNIGTIFRHEESCIVGICSQRDQDVRQSNLPNSTEGNMNIPVQAGGPPSGETSYRASYMPGSHQTCSKSSFFTGGYATATGPPPNRTAQNVHLPPEIPGSSTKFPFYQRHDRRLETFQNWQYNHVQCPKAFTDAGFFYREIEDECQCLECGLVLRKWKVQDNPWSEHARPSPDIPFVMREKGQAFVNEVRKNTAKEEIRTSSTIFRTNAERSAANPQRSGQTMIAEDNSLDCSLLDMGFTKEQIQVAINRFRKENQEGNLMSQSICGACSKREVGVSQFECGHIVCRKCAAPNVGDRCKICGKQVVKVVLFDAATLKK